ncbi:MAG: nitrate- and nitrite sensing domain-containing protein [Pirellulaceae bacterium]
MTIKQKLLVLCVVPLLGIIVLGGNAFLASRRQAIDAQQVVEMTELSVHISALVHELQKERGNTGGYLGSQGKEFKAELQKQREATDERLAKLQEYLGAFDFAAFPATLQQKHQQAEEKLNNLASTRKRVSAQDISTPDALGYYTSLNGAFLDTIGHMATVTADPKVERSLTAYQSFLKAKERAGIERAVLTNTFGRDNFGPGMYAKFIALTAVQDALLHEFRTIAEPAAVQSFEEAQAEPAFAQVESFREVALSRAQEGGFGVDAKVWFQTITKKINALKQVEDRLSEDLFHQAEDIKATATATMWIVGASVFLLTVIVAVGGYVVIRLIMKRIQAVTLRLRDIAEGEGDLTQRVAASRDELGTLAEWFNKFIDRVESLVRQIAGSATTLDGASGELCSVASSLAEGAAQSKQQSATVSSAAEEMSINMNNVASSAEQMSAGMSTVSTAVEEMTATISEIAKNAEKSATVANEASAAADKSNRSISELGAAAEEIGKVIEVIQDIAEQTNLLALNATIEAARAGEAGKGFAVVATEVKELAKQTASATDDIRRRIHAIQASTGESVESVRSVTEAIGRVTEIARSIASAVEEQNIAVSEIAKNVSETATVAEMLTRNVTESAIASKEITTSITRVDSVLNDTAAGAQQSERAGARLAELAGNLNRLVGQFKTEDQGASLSA